MIINREIRTLVDGKLVVKIKIYDSAKACLEAHWGCKFGEVQEMVGCDGQGKQYKLTPREIIENVSNTGCWGFCDQKDMLHIWFSGKCDLSDLIHLLAHERGHCFKPHYKSVRREEIKADKYGDTARFAYQTAVHLKAMVKKPGPLEKEYPGDEENW